MSSYPTLSPTGLPSSRPPYSASSSPEKRTPQLIDIFANATIPLSPTSSTSSSPGKENPYKGLKPRKRSGLARLFCCFGREERAQRRVERSLEFEQVGRDCHWTEY
ncbi:hypothetical protein EJ02DRAFT_484090 [Clathrospora elynae]|uniref:Uncharacterized protein n=1 Tax=Clathrospora elynae TaxID=706981 RepID=A0A6A5S6X2_9PLEO|nr:hypothetical protein EJ02DRAFT_484090 [Clathrospora elynae]